MELMILMGRGPNKQIIGKQAVYHLVKCPGKKNTTGYEGIQGR